MNILAYDEELQQLLCYGDTYAKGSFGAPALCKSGLVLAGARVTPSTWGEGEGATIADGRGNIDRVLGKTPLSLMNMPIIRSAGALLAFV